MTSSNGHIFRVTGHLCGAFIGHRWIPLTKASDAEPWYFLWSAPEQTVTGEFPAQRTSNAEIVSIWWRHHGSSYRVRPLPSTEMLRSVSTNQWASCQIRKIAVAHAPGMPGTFSPSPQVSDPDMHHGTCVTHVPWCMPGSLYSSFLWNWRRGKTFPAFPAHAQPVFLRIWQEAHGHTLNSFPLGQNDRRFSDDVFTCAFSWMNIFVFWIKFHRSFLLRVSLTITQYWFI